MPVATYVSSTPNAKFAVVPSWAARIALALAAVQLALSALNVLTWDGQEALDVIDLNQEGNVPAWFGSTLLAAIASVAAGIAVTSRRGGGAYLPWALVAAGFLTLSLEETAGIHERIGYRLDISQSVSDWPLLYAPLMLGGALVVLRAARDLPPRRLALVVAALALFLVVLVAEVASAHVPVGGALLAETLIEENAEILGEILIFVALAPTLAERMRIL